MIRAISRPSRCVLLFSGGIDSTLCALQLADEGHEVHALSVQYDRRPRAEVRAARRLAGALEFASRHEIRLRGLAFGPPPGAPSGVASLEGVIAHRNLVFWSLAANRAAAIGASAVAAGHTKEDARTYTDAAPSFFRGVRTLLARSGVPSPGGAQLATRLPMQEFPARHWRDVARRHADVIEQTWSCWRDGPTPCGECFACRQRGQFLSLAALRDGED